MTSEKTYQENTKTDDRLIELLAEGVPDCSEDA